MVKNELLKEIATRTGHTQKDAEEILAAFETVIVDTLKNDVNESIAFGKLGKFKVKKVPERRGIIMMGEHKGEEYVTPKHSEITFKMNKSAKAI